MGIKNCREKQEIDQLNYFSFFSLSLSLSLFVLLSCVRVRVCKSAIYIGSLKTSELFSSDCQCILEQYHSSSRMDICIFDL